MRRLRPVDGVPMARVTIAAQVVLAVILCVWLFTSSGARVPFLDSPYVVHARLPDASGLDAKDHPRVTVGGVDAGFVSDVAYDARTGGAEVTLELDDDVRGKLFGDASANVSPRSVLQDVVLDVDPGDPAAGPVRDDRITRAGTTPLGYDRALGVLDADTSAYAQVLLGTLRQVLAGRSGPLRDAIDKLPDAAGAVGEVSARLASRRREITELVTDLDKIANATGRRGGQLSRVIRSARRTLAVTQARQQEIGAAIGELPGTLGQTGTTFASLRALAKPLVPALERLRPSAKALPAGLRDLRSTLPAVNGALGDLDALVRTGRRPLADLRAATDQLGPASRELARSVPLVDSLVRNISDNEEAASRILKNWPGALSSATTLSVITRVIFLRALPLNPLAVGLPANSAGASEPLRQATAALRRARPELFVAPPAGRDAALPVVAIRALVSQLCRTGNSAACTVLSMIYAKPPKVLRP